MNKPQIKIEVKEHEWECEDCGWIEDKSVQVTFPPQKVIHGYKDGHFGSDTWNGNLDTVYSWILEVFGYAVVINEKYVYAPHYWKNHETSLHEVTELFMVPLYPIEVEVVTKEIETEYNIKYEFVSFTISLNQEKIIYEKSNKNLQIDFNKESIIVETIVKYFCDIKFV